MPTYEYECRKCGHQFEAYQSIKDEPLKRCTKDVCPQGNGRGTVKRLIGGGGGLLFKGSGFYITDYRSDSYKQAAKADSAKPSGPSEGGAKVDGAAKSESSSKSSPSGD